MSYRRTPYQRASHPKPMRLTTRDEHILETIYTYDGILSLQQIDRLFFSGKGRSQPRTRMRTLYDHGYVNMPDREHIHLIPLGETVYWLDKKGAALVAALHGETINNFRWRKTPKYALLKHDLAVNDFRIAVNKACENKPFALTRWVPEAELFAYPDTISFKNMQGKWLKGQVRPDGFFIIQKMIDSKPFAFLLEMDMSTKDNPRFIREKVLPGIAYLKSDVYRQRFGVPYGRYLVVTTGRKRLFNLKEQTEQVGGNKLFYFTTFDAVQPTTVLTDPI